MKHKNSKILTGSENFEGRRKKTFSVGALGLLQTRALPLNRKLI